MKADTWRFRVTNLLIAVAAAAMLWFIFAEHVNDLIFLVPLYWIMHVRDQTSRLRELNSRVRVAVEVAAELIENKADPDYQYETMLERHGFFEEAEKWNDTHDEVPRT